MIKFENESNGRFYYIEVKRDLLDDCVLYINYGGSNVTRHRAVFCGNDEELQQEIQRITKKRIKRGYSIVT